jgi:hypothetical protein
VIDHIEALGALGVVNGGDVDQRREPAGGIVAQEFDQGFQMGKVRNQRQFAKGDRG